jgi:hypothetical protein
MREINLPAARQRINDIYGRSLGTLRELGRQKTAIVQDYLQQRDREQVEDLREKMKSI